MSHKSKNHSTIKFTSSNVNIPPSGNVAKFIPTKTFYPVGSTIEHINLNGKNMTCRYYKCLHSLHAPSIVKSNGDQIWYKMGEIHRDGGPAVIRADGEEVWYTNGILHRDDGPAITRKNGTFEYYKNGIKEEK